MYDFPSDPVLNQEYKPSSGGQTYIFKPPRWVVKGVPPEGDNLPEAPEDGKQYARQDADWFEVVIPPPPSTAWDDIPGKPATFPPTLPIAKSDVTDLPVELTALHNRDAQLQTSIDDAVAVNTTQQTAINTNTADIAVHTTAIAGKVAKAGDTMTGNLAIAPPSGDAVLTVRKSAAGSGSDIFGSNGSLTRWLLRLGNPALESGGNVGSDLSIVRYNDAGAGVNTAFSITRATGIVSMPLGSTTLTPAAGDNSTSVVTTAWVTSRGAVAAIADAAPSSPVNGQLWWNSANGNLYIYYMDGSSNQWVQVNTVGI